MQHTIELFAANGQWMAKFSDPQVIDLFGTDTIETAFISITQPQTVLAEIVKRNPDCCVFLRPL